MPKINQEEYEVLKGLDNRWKWIARDIGGDLLGFLEKPTKGNRNWRDDNNDFLYFARKDWKKFQFIQWEDSEPHNIAELIEEYEKDYKGSWEHAIEFSREVFDESEETEVKKDIEWLKGRFRGRKIFTPQNDREIGYNMAIDEFSE